ncbi:FtsX-like permease family protein [Tumebacillus sp. BK434]|uniref:ABC transporter permease n=1 Tax=Tumebacillus sp. BK434 TaxID=2512169 RepID=UPI001048A502|nr:ABC transporter permease [Tumebacillus sp. BK434]TCP52147.1 FtsX-like permease family protein [Tumebacillus sp. BK434]
MWQYDLEQAWRSVVRRPLLSLLITMSLLAGLVLPAVNFGLFSSTYDQLMKRFFIGDSLYQTNLQIGPSLYYDQAEPTRKKLAALSGVTAVAIESNAIFTADTDKAISGVPVTWATEDLLALRGVDRELQERLFRQPNQLLLTPKYANILFPFESDPVGQQVYLAGEAFTVAGLIPHDGMFPVIDAAHGPLSGRFPVAMEIILQVEGEPKPVLAAAEGVLRGLNSGFIWRTYEDVVGEQMSGHYSSLLISLVLCALLLLFTLLNTVSFLIYKYEKEQQKWAIAYTFGATHQNLQRQVYGETLICSLAALGLLVPVLWLLQQLLSRFGLAIRLSPAVFGGLILMVLLTAGALGWLALRRIKRNDLLQALRG